MQTQKLLNFLKFSLEEKLPKMLRRMDLALLSNLCCSLLPKLENTTIPLSERGQAILMMGLIEQEFKRRYHNDIVLQKADFSKPNEVAKVLERLGGLYL